MKLLLIQPPIQDFYDTDIRLQPIGLCYLKATVERHLPKIKTIIRDYHQGWGRRTIGIPKELSYLKKYYSWPDKSPFSSFYHYYHFGAKFTDIVADIIEINPDFIGISSLFSPYYREVLKVAEEIKKHLSVPIVIGGSHVSAVPESMLRSPYVDFVICGEGEKPLVELLKTWQAQGNYYLVPNLGFKDAGKMVLNAVKDNYPIDNLPIPQLADLNQQNYLFEKRPLCFVITSRSCPHRCTFCSVHLTFGKRYRRRSPQNVVLEITKRYQEGYRVFDFEDDNLTFYKKEMTELCHKLIEAFPKKDVQFVAMNGISYLSLDSELLQLMKETGFTHLNLALVSSDKTVRETTKRPHTREKYLEIVTEAVKLGFKVVSYQIIGLPNETIESMMQTLIFSARLPVLLGASMFYLTPNSPIARGFPDATDEDIFKSRLTAMAIETDHFCRDDIYTLFVTTRIINFLKGLDFQDSTLNIEQALELGNKNRGRMAIGSQLLQVLLKQGCLYASTKNGMEPLKQFQADLFFTVWAQLEHIATLSGKTILVKSPLICEMKD